MIDIRIEKVKGFLNKYFEMLFLDSSGGIDYNFPNFDLSSYDYLEYAEEELNKGTDSSYVNCISNLKRAMDCELDTFLFIFNLYNVFTKRNLKFETKLDFLKECGVFNSRSLIRLNSIRNKMEHEYKKPQIEDIEVYYDLVVSFVSVLERTILILFIHADMDFYFDEEYAPKGKFTIKYVIEKPSIIVNYYVDNNGKIEEESFEVEIKEYKVFAYFFKVYLLLYQSCATNNRKRILANLEKVTP